MLLDDLKVSITKMSEEDLMKKILELRASRRMRKEKPAAKKAAVKADSSLSKAVDALSPEKRKKLLELLGG
jgi:predicted CopG family antitoxin